MPANTVYVGRPSTWGNPYDMWSDLPSKNQSTDYRMQCLEAYREWLLDQLKGNPKYLDPLRGHDLACWCPLTLPCHADILIDFIKKQGLRS
jgi:hypothetical protein